MDPKLGGPSCTTTTTTTAKSSSQLLPYSDLLTTMDQLLSDGCCAEGPGFESCGSPIQPVDLTALDTLNLDFPLNSSSYDLAYSGQQQQQQQQPPQPQPPPQYSELVPLVIPEQAADPQLSSPEQLLPSPAKRCKSQETYYHASIRGVMTFQPSSVEGSSSSGSVGSSSSHHGAASHSHNNNSVVRGCSSSSLVHCRTEPQCVSVNVKPSSVVGAGVKMGSLLSQPEKEGSNLLHLSTDNHAARLGSRRVFASPPGAAAVAALQHGQVGQKRKFAEELSQPTNGEIGKMIQTLNPVFPQDQRDLQAGQWFQCQLCNTIQETTRLFFHAREVHRLEDLSQATAKCISPLAADQAGLKHFLYQQQQQHLSHQQQQQQQQQQHPDWRLHNNMAHHHLGQHTQQQLHHHHAHHAAQQQQQQQHHLHALQQHHFQPPSGQHVLLTSSSSSSSSPSNVVTVQSANRFLIKQEQQNKSVKSHGNNNNNNNSQQQQDRNKFVFPSTAASASSPASQSNGRSANIIQISSSSATSSSKPAAAIPVISKERQRRRENNAATEERGSNKSKSAPCTQANIIGGAKSSSSSTAVPKAGAAASKAATKEEAGTATGGGSKRGSSGPQFRWRRRKRRSKAQYPEMGRYLLPIDDGDEIQHLGRTLECQLCGLRGKRCHLTLHFKAKHAEVIEMVPVNPNKAPVAATTDIEPGRGNNGEGAKMRVKVEEQDHIISPLHPAPPPMGSLMFPSPAPINLTDLSQERNLLPPIQEEQNDDDDSSEPFGSVLGKTKLHIMKRAEDIKEEEADEDFLDLLGPTKSSSTVNTLMAVDTSGDIKTPSSEGGRSPDLLLLTSPLKTEPMLPHDEQEVGFLTRLEGDMVASSEEEEDVFQSEASSSEEEEDEETISARRLAKGHLEMQEEYRSELQDTLRETSEVLLSEPNTGTPSTSEQELQYDCKYSILGGGGDKRDGGKVETPSPGVASSGSRKVPVKGQAGAGAGAETVLVIGFSQF